jgi:hypothetical protein
MTMTPRHAAITCGADAEGAVTVAPSTAAARVCVNGEPLEFGTKARRLRHGDRLAMVGRFETLSILVESVWA